MNVKKIEAWLAKLEKQAAKKGSSMSEDVFGVLLLVGMLVMLACLG